MPAPLKFLVIDDNADSRFLLVKTLLRKFPPAVIHECQNSEAAFELAKTEDLAAIISHRTTETAGIALLRDIRTINPDVPMVMVSGIDRTELAIAAGADRFLLYDEWLRIGTMVEELVTARTRNSNPPGARFCAARLPAKSPPLAVLARLAPPPALKISHAISGN